MRRPSSRGINGVDAGWLVHGTAKVVGIGTIWGSTLRSRWQRPEAIRTQAVSRLMSSRLARVAAASLARRWASARNRQAI
ncbi:hypothetical protein ColLi_05564 [Colletotrichum liriopes]|uniref:Uncharacterized protein n=1 Tax=Colletotrichum liriopes TaxID=708192 RepID=A0AA37GKI7_9PEZI|nr:hypothetical protein ColLi_05564 [Colletotrichum liriopes]